MRVQVDLVWVIGMLGGDPGLCAGVSGHIPLLPERQMYTGTRKGDTG